MHRLLLIIIAAFLLFGLPSAHAAKKLNGKWKVTTTLVAAQDAVNQNYEPGHIRVEAWQISGNKNGASLTSPAGTIAGVPYGKAWVFDQNYDTGYGIIIHMHIVARKLGKRKMKGTIEANYYSTQFGYLLGVDAWAFKGKKLGKKKNKKKKK